MGGEAMMNARLQTIESHQGHRCRFLRAHRRVTITALHAGRPRRHRRARDPFTARDKHAFLVARMAQPVERPTLAAHWLGALAMLVGLAGWGAALTLLAD
jgi:hypothetical protein